MSKHLVIVSLSLALLSGAALATSSRLNKTDTDRQGRLFPIFQIVNFPNDVCGGNGGRNGTCYTADECNSLGGSSSGTCAEGFGVCCVFSLSCGGSSSQNCTFLVQKSVSSVNNGRCDYKICKCASDVCRIRLDFTSFDIVGPATGSIAQADTTFDGQIGDCLTDRFSVTAPGQVGTPIICGYNTGQHVYLDAADACHTVAFDIASGDSTSRSWDIKVTQYKCGHDLAGDDGCLQYLTGVSGKIASFNFPTSASTLGASVTHLSDQHYQICIRRESGYCAICYTPSVQPAILAAIDQTSFGLNGAAATSLVATDCEDDYLSIPVGQVVDDTNTLTIGTLLTLPSAGALVMSRFCGRDLNAITAVAYIQGKVSVCSQAAPFTVGVDFDTLDALATEAAAPTGGIVGFSLDFRQVSC